MPKYPYAQFTGKYMEKFEPSWQLLKLFSRTYFQRTMYFTIVFVFIVVEAQICDILSKESVIMSEVLKLIYIQYVLATCLGACILCKTVMKQRQIIINNSFCTCLGTIFCRKSISEYEPISAEFSTIIVLIIKENFIEEKSKSRA